jgi:hypothetical protein
MNIEINILTILEKDLNNVSERKLPIFSNIKIKKIYKLIAFLKRLKRLKQEWQKRPAGTSQTDGKNLVWFGEKKRKLAKLSMPTFTYRSSS